MPRCPICNKIYGLITVTHLKTHDMTLQEFINEYPKHYQYTPKADMDKAFIKNPKNVERKKEYKERMAKNA